MKSIAAIAVVLLLVTSPALARGDDLNPDLPGADGVELEQWTSNPIPVSEGGRLVVSINKPVDWTTTVESNTILIRPALTEQDLGVLLVLQWPAPADGDVESLASSYFEDVSVVRSEPLTSDAGEARGVLSYLEAKFPDGRPAGLIGFRIGTGQENGGAVVLAGSAETVFAPWKGILRDVVTSITITVSP